MRSVASQLLAVLALLLLPAAAPAQTRPSAPPPAYQNEALANAAIRLEGSFRQSAKLGARTAAAWARYATGLYDKNDMAAASPAFAAAAAAAPNDAKMWLGYAGAELATVPSGDDDREKASDQRTRAAAAAYLGYGRAKAANDKAAALALIGEAFAGDEEWRPSLDAYRQSLLLVDDAEVRATYSDLRDEHGFRILKYEVDADSANPRICVVFSDPLLAAGRDLSSFVSVRNSPPGVTIAGEATQICVDGVTHGRRYDFTVRPGIPSTVGETLEKGGDYSVFVRDRSPAVRFTGRNYVLPRTGQRGIPVASVNTDTVLVDIYRIGDRSLAASLVDENFQQQLESYRIDTLNDRTGSKIWSGELAVAREQNADVTTAFPVESTIGAAAPGVYVMVARPKTTAAAGSDDDWQPRATQWFIISDVGMTSLNDDAGMFVMLRSLASAAPIVGATVSVVAKNNEILATASSDEHGFVRFAGGVVRGSGGAAPAMLTAETADKDYAFLDLVQPGFDLTDRGVAGRDAPGPIDAFVYTERGVYRPGETVFATVLARDDRANALAGLPLTLSFERPDGVEYRRMIVGDEGLGARSVALPISSAAMTGTWRLRVLADPKRPPVGQAKFLVEDFVPDRIEVAAGTKATALARSGTTPIDVSARFLYGAPASGLPASGDIVVSVAKEAPGPLKGYQVGVKEDDTTATRAEIPGVALDEVGAAVLAVATPELPDTGQLLEAEITVRVTEGGGRAVSRSLTLPVARSGPVIGVRPKFDGTVADNKPAAFDVVVADAAGKLVDRPGLAWTLQRVETHYSWYVEGGRWQVNSYETASRVAAGTVDARADGPATVASPVAYGRYRFEVAGSGTPPTRVAFDAGWYSASSFDTPDQLRMVLDKPSYLPGEQATVTLEPNFAGRATVMVVNDTVYATQEVEVGGGPTQVKLAVDAGWGPGAYVVAFLHRPLDVTAGRMPGRALGLSWLAVDKAPRTIGVSLAPPARMQPPGSLLVPVTLSNLAPGEDAYVALAAVDVGILNLTRYKAPAPDDWYYGQRKLGAEVRDLYGQLIDGMRATPGAIRGGGDAGEDAIVGAPPAEAPLALFSGIVKVGADGTAAVGFDIPPFNGTVRVMAVAWSAGKVGHAETDVLVRDPVVMTATLPRFLASGDRSTFRLDIDNVEGAAGRYALTIGLSGPVGAVAGDLSRQLDLAKGARTAVSVPLTGTGIGLAQVQVALLGPDGRSYERAYALGVRSSLPPVTRRSVSQLAPRTGSVVLSSDLLADFAPGSGSVTVSATPSTAIDVPALLGSLDRYPYGCSEQITSRAMPLLYLNEIASASALPVDLAVDDRVKDAIERLLARQNAAGSFGVWTVGTGDFWLDSYVADFLTRAREKGFAVPDTALMLALDNLKNALSTRIEALDDEDGSELAYALYVLARNGRAPLGDLRYLAEEKIDEFSTALGRAQLGAALAMLGDNERARRAFAKAREAFGGENADETRGDYGSALRDRAGVITLVSESRADPAIMPSLLSGLDAERNKRRRLSTQENAWLVLAAQAMIDAEKRMSLTVDGAPHAGALQRSFTGAQIAAAPVTVGNAGDARIAAVVTATGSPIVPEPPASEGFALSRKFYDLDGTELVPDRVAQTSRFVVVLTVQEPQPRFEHVLLVDRLPAGFEIDNPHLVDGASLKAFSWLPKSGGEESGGDEAPTHTEFRDDRFVAAFARDADSRNSFTAAYMVRAVSPGRYILPPATVEDMYRPERFARTGAGRVEVTDR